MRGGKRPGAGRPVGAATKRTRELAERAAAEGLTPLEYMLQILRREPPEDADVAAKAAVEAMRFEAAKAAAPYIHPKLQAIEHKGPFDGPIQIHYDLEETTRRLAFLLAGSVARKSQIAPRSVSRYSARHASRHRSGRDGEAHEEAGAEERPEG